MKIVSFTLLMIFSLVTIGANAQKIAFEKEVITNEKSKVGQYIYYDLDYIEVKGVGVVRRHMGNVRFFNYDGELLWEHDLKEMKNQGGQVTKYKMTHDKDYVCITQINYNNTKSKIDVIVNKVSLKGEHSSFIFKPEKPIEIIQNIVVKDGTLFILGKPNFSKKSFVSLSKIDLSDGAVLSDSKVLPSTESGKEKEDVQWEFWKLKDDSLFFRAIYFLDKNGEKELILKPEKAKDICNETLSIGTDMSTWVRTKKTGVYSQKVNEFTVTSDSWDDISMYGKTSEESGFKVQGSTKPIIRFENNGIQFYSFLGPRYFSKELNWNDCVSLKNKDGITSKPIGGDCKEISGKSDVRLLPHSVLKSKFNGNVILYSNNGYIVYSSELLLQRLVTCSYNYMMYSSKHRSDEVFFHTDKEKQSYKADDAKLDAFGYIAEKVDRSQCTVFDHENFQLLFLDNMEKEITTMVKIVR